MTLFDLYKPEIELKDHPGYFVKDNGKVYHNGKELKPMRVGKRGYYQVNIQGKRYLVHRLVAKAYLAGFTEDKQVHHKDGDVSNNKLSNLTYITQEEHLRLHKMKNPMTKICKNCNKVFTPHPTKRRTAMFCNRECYRDYMRKEKR